MDEFGAHDQEWVRAHQRPSDPERDKILEEVEHAIMQAAPPLNSELRYDGTADPVGAAYIEGFKDAWRVVSSMRQEQADG